MHSSPFKLSNLYLPLPCKPKDTMRVTVMRSMSMSMSVRVPIFGFLWLRCTSEFQYKPGGSVNNAAAGLQLQNPVFWPPLREETLFLYTSAIIIEYTKVRPRKKKFFRMGSRESQHLIHTQRFTWIIRKVATHRLISSEGISASFPFTALFRVGSGAYNNTIF